jgi:hypothetical protein
MSIELYKVQKNSIKKRDTGAIIYCRYNLVRLKNSILEKYYLHSSDSNGIIESCDVPWGTENYDDAVKFCDALNDELIRTNKDYELLHEIVYEGSYINEK